MWSKYKERDYLNKCHNLLILGGTFDPIHMGHLAIAKAAYLQLKPQRVLFIPSGQSPHKRDKQITGASHRYNMTAFAVCEHPAFDISRIEINRQGPSYTIDTARNLRKICPAGAKIRFLIGDDALQKILSWKDAEELLKDFEFVTVPRPGYEKCDASDKSISDFVDYLGTTYNARIHRLSGPLLNISSTDIRKRLTAGQTVHGLIPKPVEVYAKQHGLYAAADVVAIDYTADSPASGKFCFEAAQEELRIRLSPERYAHSMGVISTAEKLAAHYGQDAEKTRIAALLHDCAKEYSADKKRALCQLWGIQLDEALESNIEVAHSLLGAESAKRDFHIYDTSIQQAIRYHTTGYIGMTILDKIIMLADYIEPNRSNWGPIKEMRRLALTDINQALIIRIEYNISKEKQAGRPIHPWSLDTLKELTYNS